VNIHILAPKIRALEMGPKSIKLFCKKNSIKILIKFWEFMDTICPNKLLTWYLRE
jgi:hypothetical protein